jgi:hypothetical protein
MAQVVVTNR